MWIMLLWMWASKYLFKSCFQLFAEVELIDNMVQIDLSNMHTKMFCSKPLSGPQGSAWCGPRQTKGARLPLHTLPQPHFFPRGVSNTQACPVPKLLPGSWAWLSLGWQLPRDPSLTTSLKAGPVPPWSQSHLHLWFAFLITALSQSGIALLIYFSASCSPKREL